jgi:DNA topoisomerase-1
VPHSLVIVESPAKARTIEGYLRASRDGDRGGDAELHVTAVPSFAVGASIGHVRDLPPTKKDVPKAKQATHGRLAGVNPDDHFDVVYVIPRDKQQVIKELKEALKGADELILATDEDREGEAIAWHLTEVLQPAVPVKRMVFHEITPHAIREALEHPREIDLDLVEAQEARRVLDRLMGWELSPVLWRKIGKAAGSSLSAGRVQSVATRLVVERERARMRFVRSPYWSLDGEFAAGGDRFTARLREVDGRRPADGKDDFDPETGALLEGRNLVQLDEEAARGLAERLTGRPFTVASVESTPRQEAPRAPFTTSTLQQEAGRKLRFSSARTMAVAQRLYERGYITYMRTDSTNLAEQAVSAARREIARRYGEEYLPDAPRTYQGKVKNAQEAHEAIRPAGDEIRSPEAVASELDRDERRLYELVWLRTIACQMVNARYRQVAIDLTGTSSAGEAVRFRVSGRIYDFRGWRAAYEEGRDDDGEADEQERALPSVAEGDDVDALAFLPLGHETSPPPRYTEATLVKELEERGIGRPSTYASTIQTIQDRGYVWKLGSALVADWKAFAVTKILEDHFSQLVDYEFTALMEEALDAISRGETEAEKWLHAFYFGDGQAGLRELVSEERLAEIDRAEVNAITIGTTAGGEPVVVRVWPNGASVHVGEASSPLPRDLPPADLTVAQAVELVERAAQGPRRLGTDPDTGLEVLVLDGPYGPYVQLGDGDPAGKKAKPKTASLFKTMNPDRITLDDALALLSLPRVVGVDDDGVEITAQNGRFGPYIKRGPDTRSLDTEEQILTIDREQALALLAQPKRRRATKPPLAELGTSDVTGKRVVVKEGRYGTYVTDGETNATIPRGRTPEELTLQEALDLLAERRAKGPAAKKAGARRSPARKAPAASRRSARRPKR